MASLDQFVLKFDDNFGRPYPGAKLFAYEAGTTTQKSTYTDLDLADENEWPVIADAAGYFPPIFLEPGAYRFIIQDGDGVQRFDRDNLNASENLVLTSSNFVFSTLIDAKQGILINGESINLQVGQAVKTLGSNTSTDGEGADWVVVPNGTGTADDDLFADLSNGLQIQRIFNQLYVKNNLSEISDAGAIAQAEARANIGIQEPSVVTGYTASQLYYLNNDVPGNKEFNVNTLPNATWESIGPTGSGADNIWADLDDIPSDAKYIDLNVFIDRSIGISSVNVTLFFRPFGSSAATADAAVFQSSVEAAGATATGSGQAGFFRVWLSGNNLFEAYRGSTDSATIGIIGFGL